MSWGGLWSCAGFKPLQNHLLALQGLTQHGSDPSKLWVRLLVPHINNMLSEKGSVGNI